MTEAVDGAAMRSWVRWERSVLRGFEEEGSLYTLENDKQVGQVMGDLVACNNIDGLLKMNGS